MNIDIPDALAMQDVTLDEPKYFVALGHRCGRQILEHLEDRLAVMQTSAGDLTNHIRIYDDGRSFQQVDKSRVATPKVIDPNGRVGHNQTGRFKRLRGAAFNVGCVPPSRAGRLALSRSMRAFDPSLTMPVRSIGPTSLAAFASNSSSMLMIVRMISPSGISIKFGII